MHEKRQFPRKNLIYYVKARCADTGDVLGYISDLSAGGFMLTNTREHEPGAVLKVDLEPTFCADDRDSWVPAEIKCCWSFPVNRDDHEAGFTFTGSSNQVAHWVDQCF